MSLELTLECARTGCGEMEVVELNEPITTGDKMYFGLPTEEWPEGWGWDPVGNDTVLHCAEHRPDDDHAHKRMDDARAAARDDARGERDR